MVGRIEERAAVCSSAADSPQTVFDIDQTPPASAPPVGGVGAHDNHRKSEGPGGGGVGARDSKLISWPLQAKDTKAGVSLSTKERKERVNGKIIALQQLVSPYGKVLSAPYHHGSPTAKILERERDEDVQLQIQPKNQRFIHSSPILY